MDLKARQICRFCLTENEDFLNIFKNADRVSLPFMAVSVTSLEISESDNMPRLICHPCRDLITAFHEFKNNCKKSDFALRFLSKTGKFPEEFSDQEVSKNPPEVPQIEETEESLHESHSTIDPGSSGDESDEPLSSTKRKLTEVSNEPIRKRLRKLPLKNYNESENNDENMDEGKKEKPKKIEVRKDLLKRVDYPETSDLSISNVGADGTPKEPERKILVRKDLHRKIEPNKTSEPGRVEDAAEERNDLPSRLIETRKNLLETMNEQLDHYKKAEELAEKVDSQNCQEKQKSTIKIVVPKVGATAHKSYMEPQESNKKIVSPSKNPTVYPDLVKSLDQVTVKTEPEEPEEERQETDDTIHPEIKEEPQDPDLLEPECHIHESAQSTSTQVNSKFFITFLPDDALSDPSSAKEAPASEETSENEDDSASKVAKLAALLKGTGYGTKEVSQKKGSQDSSGSIPVKSKQCSKCSKFFKSDLHLAAHMKKQHDDNASKDNTGHLKCSDCDVVFITLRALRIHQRRVHMIKTAYAVSSNPKILNPTFCCPKCNENFQLHSDLEKHLMETHTLGIMKCDTCGTSFISEKSLQYHISRAHGKKTQEDSN